MADAGEDDFGGAAEVGGVLGDEEVFGGAGLAGLGAEVAERFDDAGEVAGFVVDDGDHGCS